MTAFSSPSRTVVLLVKSLLFTLTTLSLARAQVAIVLPNPLKLDHVLALASERREEIAAMRARSRAAAARPDVVSAWEDPMLAVSLDHVPFGLHGVEGSVTLSQRFPLSSVLDQRRRVAEAQHKSASSDVQRTRLDVRLEVTSAYFMLWERREMLRIVGEQLALSQRLVLAASARYASAIGGQPEVLRAEMEVARLAGDAEALSAEINAAEAMLLASLALPALTSVPPIVPAKLSLPPPAPEVLTRSALARRPELQAGAFAIEQADAEVEVMKSMYTPMAMVQAGPAYTMADGPGWMLMVGVSLPLWRGGLNAGVREAEAMEAMARHELVAMRRMVEGEVLQARALLLAGQSRVQSLRSDILPRARQALEPTFAAYGAGLLPLVSVLDALRALWGVELELVDAEMRVGILWARLRRTTGEEQVR